MGDPLGSLGGSRRSVARMHKPRRDARSGPRIAAIAAHRILLSDGLPTAALEGRANSPLGPEMQESDKLNGLFVLAECRRTFGLLWIGGRKSHEFRHTRAKSGRVVFV
jgi:hypothetical protein